MTKTPHSKKIDTLIDEVAENPEKAPEAKRAIRQMIGMRDPGASYIVQRVDRPRRSVAEIDDDLFDNMPI